LLDQLVEEYPDAECIHVICDNFVIHSSKITQRHVAKLDGKVVLHFLPPYCPDDNPIERVWQDLHANVTGCLHDRLAA
jgi:transposase